MEEILRAQGISKNFAGVHALTEVDFTLNKGEIHALVGENGAGKSTLMKIFMGEHQPDAGEIFYNGEKIRVDNPRMALETGIAMVHQELHYMPYLSITDYMNVGREPSRMGFTDPKRAAAFAKEQLSRIQFDVDTSTLMGDLMVSQIQMVEIAKIVSYGSKVLILDEPTSSLTVQESARLFDILRQLKEEGVSMIYISHKLDELEQIADRVTVLRDGHVILTDEYANLTRDKLVGSMIGRELANVYQPKSFETGEMALEVKGFTRPGEFEDISFYVKRGEVVGLAGLVGAGRTEIVTSIFGERKRTAGELYLFGKKVEIRNARQAIRKGLALVTEDRKRYGLNLIGSVTDNMTLANMKHYSKRGIVSQRKMSEATMSMVDELSIKLQSIDRQVLNLSGGNQQKVVLGKWLLTEPEIIIFDEPARGIDVGAKSEFYKIIAELAKNGKAVLLISSEMPEIIGLCTRVYVLHEGHMRGELVDTPEKKEISEESIVNLFF